MPTIRDIEVLTEPFGDQQFNVYETNYLGEEQPETWWVPRRVVGVIVFGAGGSQRTPCRTANVLGPADEQLLGEMEFAAVVPHEGGLMAITGFQRPAHIKDLWWRIRSYPQVWLCVPRPKQSASFLVED